jgi:hypothetical protein
MMDHNFWGMGWGIWIIPLAILLIIIIFLRNRKN